MFLKKIQHEETYYKENLKPEKYNISVAENKTISLVLGKYKEGELSYAGTGTWGVRRELLKVLRKGKR